MRGSETLCPVGTCRAADRLPRGSGPVGRSRHVPGGFRALLVGRTGNGSQQLLTPISEESYVAPEEAGLGLGAGKDLDLLKWHRKF